MKLFKEIFYKKLKRISLFMEIIFFYIISVPPLSLLLQGLNHALVAGTRTHVTCTAVGARPAPHIVWAKGGQVIKGATQSVRFY